MKQTHQLLKLRLETVNNLKRLLAQTGQAGLDDLVMTMIRLTKAHQTGLKETGWAPNSKR